MGEGWKRAAKAARSTRKPAPAEPPHILDTGMVRPKPLDKDTLPYRQSEAREVWTCNLYRMRDSFGSVGYAVWNLWVTRNGAYDNKPPAHGCASGSQTVPECWATRKEAAQALYCDLRDEMLKKLGLVAEWATPAIDAGEGGKKT